MGDDEQQPTESGDVPAGDADAASGWRRNLLGWGALAAVASAVLAIAANLSEVAGWFAPDETRELVAETRETVQGADQKIEELLVLLRNQAAASGLDLNLQSETAIRNAVQAIVLSGNTQKQAALEHLNEGDVAAAADMMTRVASSQASAVSETSEAAANSWREAGALYYTIDMERAVESYRTALRLMPGHAPSLDMLGHALIRAGRLDEAAAAFEEILSLGATPADRSDALSGLGYIAKQRGHYPTAERHYRAALEAIEGEQKLPQHVNGMAAMGQLDIARGDFESATRWLRRALAMARDIGHDKLQTQALSGLATIAGRQERFDDAEALLQQALQIHESNRDLAGRAIALGNLGAVALARGDIDTAQARIAESAELSERLGWQSSLAYDLVNLAAIASARDEFDQADDHLSRAQRIAGDVGLTELMPVIIFNRGEIARDAGDIETACAHWLAALPLLVEMGSAHVREAEEAIRAAACVQPGSQAN